MDYKTAMKCLKWLLDQGKEFKFDDIPPNLRAAASKEIQKLGLTETDWKAYVNFIKEVISNYGACRKSAHWSVPTK